MRSRLRVRSGSALLLKFAHTIVQIVEELINLTQQELEIDMLKKMIRIYRLASLLRKLFGFEGLNIFFMFFFELILIY